MPKQLEDYSSLRGFITHTCLQDYPDHWERWRSELVKGERRLLAVCSRDHGKTTFFSIDLPLYLCAFNPRYEACIISYSEQQASKIVGKISDLVDSGQSVLAQLKPENYRDSWSKSKLTFFNKAYLDSLSFGSAGRGSHYDLIVVDDPVKDFGGMETEDQIRYFCSVILPMLKPDGILIVVGNYVYDGDLIDWIESNKSYRVIKNPAIYDEGPLSGLPLWPERWPLHKLEARRADMGEVAFAREYLLKKVNYNTQFFRTDRFRYYDDILDLRTRNYIFVDPAITTSGDYTAMTVVGMDLEEKEYVLDYINKKSDDVMVLVDNLFTLVGSYNVGVVYFETIGFQKLFKHILYEEMRKRKKFFGIEEIRHHKKSKEARIMALQPKVESGNLMFRREHMEMIDQFKVFPHGRHDDLIDALSMSMGKLTKPDIIPTKLPDYCFEWWAKKVNLDHENTWQKTMFKDIVQ